ncbi:MAG: hypothetical protein IGBAC_0539 [Ignavibacteriae bacterium]|nr:MAG: hypothetical protein IGBAC_0539 [Ignavibacteriota bacterium]
METRLINLYTLQLIDSHLDELEYFKGDLPQKVRDLSEKVDNLKQKISEKEQEIKNLQLKSDEADLEMVTLAEKIEKYKKQLFQVKTNKQYDALTTEIDNAEKNIEELTKQIAIYDGHIQNAKGDLETFKKELVELEEELTEKQEELAKISKENEEEELTYKHKREKILVKISKSDLALYERIRKAKDGKAVVAIRRNSCGGCFNTVPIQKIVELRQNRKIFTCEQCGRILVSDYIVEESKKLI